MNSFILAARPKTLPAAIVPVWMGCVLTYDITGVWDMGLAIFTLMGAVFIQIGTNFFNDAIDADKGADTDARLGPVRIIASGSLLQRACVVAFGIGLRIFSYRGTRLADLGNRCGISIFFLWVYGWSSAPCLQGSRGGVCDFIFWSRCSEWHCFCADG